MAEKGLPKIGVDMYHLALVTSDVAPNPATGTPGDYTHSIPEHVPGTVGVSFTPEQEVAAFHADNGVYASAKGAMAVSPEHEMADVPLSILAKYFGGSYVGGIYHPVAHVDPEIAEMYRIKKSDGHYRYFRFYKGKANMPSMDATTQADGVDFGTSSFTFAGEMRQMDGQPFGILDDDSEEVKTAGLTPAQVQEMWFRDLNWKASDGYTPAPGTTYTATVVPDNAANGSVTVNPPGAQPAGTVLTISATAESGFAFDHWSSDNGGVFADTGDANTTFTMPAANVTITAHFV